MKPVVSSADHVPLIDINCAHCSSAAMHYRLLYSEYVTRMEELRIMRNSQSEHAGLVNELHHLRGLFEDQRRQLESMVPPSSKGAANAGLFEYLKVLSGEHRRRMDEMRSSFDAKLIKLKQEHEEELRTVQEAGKVVDVEKLTQTETELASVKAEYAAALEREVALNTELTLVKTELTSKDAQLKALAFDVADAASDAADESLRRDKEFDDLQMRMNVAQQLITSLKSSLEDARRSNEVLEGVQAELTRRLKTSCEALQDCQRTSYTEQQEILKKRDALQIRLFDMSQSVTTMQRRVEEMETRMAQQEPYVQVARDMQALILQLPDEPCPPLVSPKSAAPHSNTPSGTASNKKKKGVKK